MTLVQLWEGSREQFTGKKVQQVIAFAGGGGKLRDGGEASEEFRAFLRIVPSELLARYAGDCLAGAFDEGGFALQDIVNEVGRRLGFEATAGRYRGVPRTIGYDGLWRSPKGFSIVVEVKTTDAYRIDLDTVAGYQLDLIGAAEIDERASSVLVVVGREDTGGLEAQVRGSRHAWDIRLISVEALLRLLKVKENTEDPRIHQQIAKVLVPSEFTRLDGIIDLVFSTIADLSQQEEEESSTGAEEPIPGGREPKPETDFRESCVARIQKHLKHALVKRSRVLYGTPDGRTLVMCAVSREYADGDRVGYWFGFHEHQGEALRNVDRAFVAFGCGSDKNIVLIPFKEFDKMIDKSWRTEREGKAWWHVVIERDLGGLVLRRRKGKQDVDLSPFVLPGNP